MADVTWTWQLQICWKSHRMHKLLCPTSISFSRSFGGTKEAQQFKISPLYRIRSFLSLLKFIQMLLLTPASFFSQSLSCKTEPRSLLISFTPRWATTINLSQLPTHNLRAEHTMLWTSPGCHRAHHCGKPDHPLSVISTVLIVADGAIELKIIQNKTGISNWDQLVKSTEHSLGCSWSQLSTSHLKCTSKGRTSEGGGKEMR